MRILFILENYYPNVGGVETLFKSLVDSLKERGNTITVLTNRNNSKLPIKEQFGNVKILRFPFINRYLFTFLAWIPSTFYAFKNDIIHTTSYNAGIPAFIASLLSRTKVIITFHEVWGKLWFDLPFFGKLSLWLHYTFEKLLLKLPFHRFVAVSKFTATSLEEAGVKTSKISMIYNGIDYNEFDPRFSMEGVSKHQIIYFGRLGISKGIDLILNSMAILKSESIDSKLLMVIPTTPHSIRLEIEKLIIEYKIENKVIIKSNLSFDELKKNIKSSLAVVIPSYSEGFCFAAAEAIALNVPIISSNKGALKEVVSGKHLTLDHLTAECLANGIKKALKNEWKETPVIMYPLEFTIDKYISLYEKELSK